MKVLAGLIITVIMFAGCDKPVESLTTPFVVHVDSITHPSFAASNDTVPLHFFGTIGPNGCHSFSHFEITRSALQLDITVWGQREKATVCPHVMVYLDGKQYTFVPEQVGWFTINIHQPEGSIIRDSIIVK